MLAFVEASRKSVAPESDQLLHPAPGQFHPLAAETDMWEAYVLVLERNGDVCQVIPGSMNPLKGGPSDILIPAPENPSQYWTLNLGLKQELHVDALLPGFASLMPGLLNYVKYGLNKFELGEPLGDKFRFCLPYIGKSDSRRVYRDELADLVKKANLTIVNALEWSDHRIHDCVPLWHFEDEYAYAAGDEQEMIFVECSIDHHEEVMTLRYYPDQDSVWIRIFNADKKSLSFALDGTEIIDAEGHVLGTIQNGKSILNVKKRFDGRIILRKQNGMICQLRTISQQDN